jgi:hypothetical protein
MRKRATLSSELPLGAVLKDLAYALFGGLTPLLVSWLVHFDRIVPGPLRCRRDHCRTRRNVNGPKS